MNCSYGEILEPISLTREILEKNEFVFVKSKLPSMSEDKVWQVKDDEKQVLVELEEQTDDNFNVYYIGKFYCGANSCEIYFKYIHQL